MKNCLAPILALCISLMLTSCDETKVRKGEITGKWQFSKITVSDYGGQSGLTDYLSEYANGNIHIDQDATYTYRVNNTGTYSYSEGEGTVSENFSYSITQNVLTMVMDNDPGDVRVQTIQSITNAEMVWTVDITQQVNEAMVEMFGPNFNTFTRVLAHIHLERK